MGGLPQDLNLNCPCIDRDHSVLIGLTYQLTRLLADRETVGRASKLVIQLKACFDAHFEHEEQLIRQSGYRAGASHIREHRQLQTRFDSVVKACGEEDYVSCIVMLAAVETWLFSHVRSADRILARHLRAREMHTVSGNGLLDREPIAKMA